MALHKGMDQIGLQLAFVVWYLLKNQVMLGILTNSTNNKGEHRQSRDSLGRVSSGYLDRMYKIIHSCIHGSYECVSVRPVWAVLLRPQVDMVIFFQTRGTWGSATLRYTCRTTWGCIGEVAAMERQQA